MPAPQGLPSAPETDRVDAAPDPAPPPKPRRGPLAPLAWQIPALLLILSGFVPLVHDFSIYHTDWLTALSVLHEQGAIFGRDVIFTYGPWGFAWASYHPATFGLLCLVWVIIALTVWNTLRGMLSQSLTARPALAGVLLLLLVLPFSGDHAAAADLRLLLLPALLLMDAAQAPANRTSRPGLILALVVGFAGLIKFTVLVAGAAAVLMLAIEQIVRRRWPWTLVAYGVGVAVGWLLAAQPVSTFPAFLAGSWEVSRAYAAAMARGRPGEWIDVLLGATATVFFLTMLSLDIWRARRWGMLPLIGGMGVVLLIAFRASYVRHDQHALTLLPLLLGLSMVAMAAHGWRRSLIGWSGWCFCVLLAGVATDQTMRAWLFRTLAQQTLQTLSAVPDEIAELMAVAQGRELRVAAAYRQRLAEVASLDPLPKLQGAVDAFPDELMPVFANGYTYSARPTLVGYSAYSPSLAAANAAHLASPDAPQHLLVRFDAIDRRLTTMQDNLAWLALLEYYQLDQTVGRISILTRREKPAILDRELVLDTSIQMGQALPLPDLTGSDSPLLWMEIHAQRRPLGSALAQLYKPPTLTLAVRTRNDDLRAFRLLSENAAAGFILQPLPDGPELLQTLLKLTQTATAPPPPAATPVRITVRGAGNADVGRFFAPSIRVKLYRMRLRQT
jgi:hypothetical protein